MDLERLESKTKLKSIKGLKGFGKRKLSGLKGIGKKKGWAFEGSRHSLAARGIRTGRKKKRKTDFRKQEAIAAFKKMNKQDQLEEIEMAQAYPEREKYNILKVSKLKKEYFNHSKGKKSFATIARMKMTPKIKKAFLKRELKKLKLRKR